MPDLPSVNWSAVAAIAGSLAALFSGVVVLILVHNWWRARKALQPIVELRRWAVISGMPSAELRVTNPLPRTIDIEWIEARSPDSLEVGHIGPTASTASMLGAKFERRIRYDLPVPAGSSKTAPLGLRFDKSATQVSIALCIAISDPTIRHKEIIATMIVTEEIRRQMN